MFLNSFKSTFLGLIYLSRINHGFRIPSKVQFSVKVFQEKHFIAAAHAFKLKAFILFENFNHFNNSFLRSLAPPSIKVASCYTGNIVICSKACNDTRSYSVADTEGDDSVYLVQSTPLRAFTGSFQRFADILQTYWRCAWGSLMLKKYFFDKLTRF